MQPVFVQKCIFSTRWELLVMRIGLCKHTQFNPGVLFHTVIARSEAMWQSVFPNTESLCVLLKIGL